MNFWEIVNNIAIIQVLCQPMMTVVSSNAFRLFRKLLMLERDLKMSGHTYRVIYDIKLKLIKNGSLSWKNRWFSLTMQGSS
jgi:hypothetical protein